MSRSTLLLRPKPPFRLDLTVWTLRRRPDNAIDRWDGASYRRVLALTDGPIEITIAQQGTPETPRLEVQLSDAAPTSGMKAAVRAAVENLLGLRIDLADFYRLASHDSDLEPLVQRFRGMKPPRFPTVFESVVNGIACQQLTLTFGITLLNRLTETFGLAAGSCMARAFPRPQEVAARSAEGPWPPGLSRQKTRAIRELAEGVVRGTVDLEGLAALTDEAAVAQLQQLRGVGRWTAEYALLRGLGRLNVFPGDDVGGQNNLRRWLRLPEPVDYVGVRRLLARWEPFGGLIYFHLLLDRLAEAGLL